MSIARRRDFLKSAALTAGSLAFAPAARSAAPAGRIRFAAQTNAYPIDPRDFNTFLAAVGKLKDIGFAGFETGFRNVQSQFDSPARARDQIASTGMTFFGVHIFLGGKLYDPETLIAPAALYQKVAEGGKSLGALNLICSGAAAETPQQLHAKVAGLNAAAAFCQTLGLGFAYHNEEPESASRLNELDVLYSETTPAVKFLFDVGHLYNVGGDVVAFIRKHHARIAALHLRDYRDRSQVVLGTGTLPLAAIAQALRQASWSGWVECEEERLDGVKHGDEFMRPAFAALQGAFHQ